MKKRFSRLGLAFGTLFALYAGSALAIPPLWCGDDPGEVWNPVTRQCEYRPKEDPPQQVHDHQHVRYDYNPLHAFEGDYCWQQHGKWSARHAQEFVDGCTHTEMFLCEVGPYHFPSWVKTSDTWDYAF